MRRIVLLFGLTLVLSTGGAHTAQGPATNPRIEKAKRKPAPGFKVEAKSTGGLLTTTFTTPEGYIFVHLPASIRRGDRISGLAIATPVGQTQEQRAKNQQILSTYRLMIANQRIENPWFTHREACTKMLRADYCGMTTPWTLDGTLIDTYDTVIFQDVEWRHEAEWSPNGAVCITRMRIRDWGEDEAPDPVCLIPDDWLDFDEVFKLPTLNDFQLPTIGQNGRSIEIKGPFNGNLRNTEIKIGGRPVTKLAESPRSCIFRSPDQNFGPTEITVKENNVETKGTYRNIGVRLSAPKTNLLKGEKTTVTIEVSGLQGIKDDVPLQLDTRGVAQMDGGNSQRLLIRPQDVQTGGRYTTTRGITGQQAGGFSVIATVLNPRPELRRLSEKLRQIRNALGLSLTEMSKRLGLDASIKYSTISDYEFGFDKPPLTILLQYARLANVAVDVLIDDELDLPAKLPARKQ